MKMTDLKDLLKHELSDLYSAEKQITQALPKMAKGATNPTLRQAFQDHLQQTETHIARLESVFEQTGLRPERKKCEAMEGLLKEGDELLKSGSDPDVMDAGLIGAAQRVEHYEIAGYGCARTYAKLLGLGPSAQLLQTTLDEEGASDKKLTMLAQTGINVAAIDNGSTRSSNGAGNGSRPKSAQAGNGSGPKSAQVAKAKAPAASARSTTARQPAKAQKSPAKTKAGGVKTR